ncbi:MAG: carbohydrate ABC transporter permease [Saccharofermentanales bacterium]
MTIKKLNMTLARKKQIYGILFCLPFIIGFIFFFLSPIAFYLRLAFSKMVVFISVGVIQTGRGLSGGVETMGGLQLDYVGLENFKIIFLSRAPWIQKIWGNLSVLAYHVPSVVLFSFFVSIILNQKFKGRFAARAVFFLPVIIASGAIAVFNTDNLSQLARAVVMGQDEATANMGINTFYRTMLSLLGQNEVSRGLINTVGKIISSLDWVIESAGVQILIFLAGLQTIPVSLYEASHMDGASSWENFWKITLPMLSPILLVNTAYTIIDTLAAPDNWVIRDIYIVAMNGGEYSVSAAMGVFYFTIVLSLVGLLLFFMSKLVYYEDR